VLEQKDVLELKEKVNRVHISDAVMGYVQQIIAQTRAGNGFSLGASPRALLQLLKAAQAKASLGGRDFVKPDDVKKTVKNVLSHRLIPTTEMKLQKKKAEDLLDLMLLKISVPVE
jgi:MoxR-like ATPase